MSHSAAKRRSHTSAVIAGKDWAGGCRRGCRSAHAAAVRSAASGLFCGPQIGEMNGHLAGLQMQDGGLVDDLKIHVSWVDKRESVKTGSSQSAPHVGAPNRLPS